MAHFAKLDSNNIVIDVNVVNNEDIQDLPFPESEAVGIAFLDAWAGESFNWKQTSYSASFRKNYASIGFTYDSVRDAFIPPQPYLSWVLNEDKCIYEAPVPYPTDGNAYSWNEQQLNWIAKRPFTPVEVLP